MPDYKLAENVPVLKSDNIFNVYITKQKVYFVKVDRYTPELRRLNKKFFAYRAVGMRFGLLGALIIVWPASAYYRPKIAAERTRALDMLRNIPAYELDTVESYNSLKHEVRFEEKRKDRQKIHLGKDSIWLSGDEARKLQLALQ